MKTKNKYWPTLLLAPSVLFFLYWLFEHYINKPLVWDETVSLINFVLVDFKTTVTHYPDVNNHIFFNLVNNVYCKLIGVGDVYEAMDHIPLMRMLTLAITAGTFIYTYLCASKFSNRAIAVMAVAVLVTTMPFLNFTMQFRGYTFSTFLLIASLFHLLNYDQKGKWKDLVLLYLYLTSLLYTIPSNVFTGISLGLIVLLFWLNEVRQKRKGEGFSLSTALRNKKVQSLMVVGAAGITSYILYLPILEDMMNESHLQQMKGKSFYAYNLEELFPTLFMSFLSMRYLIVFPMVMGLAALIQGIRKKGLNHPSIYYPLLYTLLLILPWLISFIRGDKTPPRSMVPLVPIYAILVSISIFHLIRGIKVARKYLGISIGLILVYCFASYGFARKDVNDELHKALILGKKVNSITYNFYQSDEYDLHKLDALVQEVKKTGYPIIMAREIDRVSEGEYLHKHNLKYYATVWAKQAPAKNEVGFQYEVLLEISQGRGKKPAYERIGFPPSIQPKSGRVVPIVYYLIEKKIIDPLDPKYYVLTYDTRMFEEAMKKDLPFLKFKRFEQKLSYHNIYLVTKRESSGR